MIARIERGMSEMREEMASRFDRTVSTDLYAVQQKATQEDMAELRRDVDAQRESAQRATRELREEIRAEARQRITDRRWWLTAVGIPIGALILQYVGPLIGGAS